MNNAEVNGQPAQAPVAAPPASPRSCRGFRGEYARLQWRVGEPGDPAQLLQDFLVEQGLAVDSVQQLGAAPADHGSGRLCGAAVFVSAAAGAAMLGAPAGPPSPAPAVPDVVAVVYHHRAGPAAPTPVGAAMQLGEWQESWSPERHADAVLQVQAAISRGELHQLNLVGHGCAPYNGDPLPALARLGALPGARYGGVLTGVGWAVGCASPETLIQVTAGRMRTRPIKGTRPATAAGRSDLLASVKERAEHAIAVDLARSDLGRVARTGTVRVDELFALRRWCRLWQAESVISAQVEAGVGLADLLRAVSPGGSVAGAPKRAALALIAVLEPVGRGASMGALGWVGPEGVDLGLTIRTAAADGRRLHVWAGGGITWDSDPQAEVAEAAAKAAPLRAALTGG
ncbi:MAG TPA: chorismate-binding protein [Micromonosporaceae bacterium]|nr:chorismate-binding protein [Micromonosporaceae bacterium]